MERSLERHGLSPDVTASLIQLAERYQISKLILFGSRACGTHRPRSDVDLAVSGGDVTRFTLAVDEDTPTLLCFDVVDLGGAVQRELLSEIEKDGVILYEKA